MRACSKYEFQYNYHNYITYCCLSVLKNENAKRKNNQYGFKIVSYMTPYVSI